MFVVVQHSVRDYDAWKPAFDEHESFRAKHGCKGHTVYRDADRPNEVTVFTRWESREQAEKFTGDPSLAEAMRQGGVIGEPRVMYVEEADTRSYSERRAA